MQLKFNKTIRKNIITVDLEATKFTECELEAFRRFGEPKIIIEKMYPLDADDPSFPVRINKKLRQSFRVRVKFDGTNDIEAACDAAESFYDDIVEVLEDALYELTDKLEDSFTRDLGGGVEIIRSGTEMLPPTQKPNGCIPPQFNPGNHITAPKPNKPSYGNGSHNPPPPKPYTPPCDCDHASVIWVDGDSLHV